MLDSYGAGTRSSLTRRTNSLACSETTRNVTVASGRSAGKPRRANFFHGRQQAFGRGSVWLQSLRHVGARAHKRELDDDKRHL